MKTGMRVLPAGIVAVIFAVMTFPLWPMTDTRASDQTRAQLRRLVARADSGDPKALYDLAYLHDIGYDTITRDTTRSTLLYTRSAEKGYAPAQNYLGFRLYKGDGVNRDVNEGLHWIEQAALQGDPKGANNLGWMLLEGEGVEHDYSKAAFWLERAADAGVPTGMVLFADMLKEGKGLPPDTLRATELYSRAIESGLMDAEVKLLVMMNEKWKSLSPEDALKLGKFYYTHRAPVIGVTLFNNVAFSEANDSLKGEAFALLGDAHTRAQGVDYNHAIALDNFIRAAEFGNPSAQFILGELLDIFPDALADKDLPMECHSAQYWYDRASKSGVTDAETANRILLHND